MIRVSAMVALALLLPLRVTGGTEVSQSRSTLKALSRHFDAARASPPGSRPATPNIDLRALVGVPSSAVRASLGTPATCAWVPPPKLIGGECWSYVYGPKAVQTPVSVDLHNGYEEITVVTGGPFLLMLNVSEGHIAAAKWLGQR